jgi:2-keto-4-pentenoate hydratase/2-oxohepta-3-ene-1,7-dioic acid hydratase in catechol pathway
LEGLKPRLEGYLSQVADKIARPGVEICNLGLIDSPEKALEAGHAMRRADVDIILLPRHLSSDRVDYECELAVVIGRDCKNVSASKAIDYVAGYTCANDVSVRDWQKSAGGGQWCRGKTLDTFCPLGPYLVTPDEIPDPQNLKIRTLLNGEAVQNWSTNDMIFTVAQIIEFLSGSTTLPAGTVILTGTPHGVGMASTPPRWLQPGDQVTIEIEKIGSLTNPVAEELTP